MSEFQIRLYRPEDRPSVRRICAQTAWLGEPAPERIIDEWVWSEFWTRYFTDGEPEHVWVAERGADATVVGYLTGTVDARRCDRYFPRLLPGLARRAVGQRLFRRETSRHAMFGLLRSMLRGELSVPRSVRKTHPATLHMNLLACARGHGLGRSLFECYRGRMRQLGVRGVHAQTLSVNARIADFNRAAGFRLVQSRELTAYRRFDPTPIAVQTWTLDL